MASNTCTIIKGTLLRSLICLLGIALVLQAIPSPGAAQETERTKIVRTKDKIFIRSNPVFPESLPLPGNPFDLTFELYNAHDLPKTVRALIVVDGKFTEVYVPGGYLNKTDRPEYKVRAYSPIAEISYQLIVEDYDGTFFKSNRFSVTRNCVSDLTMTDLKEDWRISGNERLNVSYHRANALERELNAYDRTIELLEELENLMDQ